MLKKGDDDVDHELLVHMITHSPEAILLLDTDCNITFFNKGAERLFQQSSEQVMNKILPLSSEYLHELEVAFERAKQQRQSYFKAKYVLEDKKELNLIFTIAPVFANDRLTALSCFVREVDFLRKISSTQSNFTCENREPKRTFKQIRNRILLSLDKGRMTINQIGSTSGINWKTVEKHLTFLIGKKLVDEIFSSEYVRIFELTPRGKSLVNDFKNKEISKIIGQSSSLEQEELAE